MKREPPARAYLFFHTLTDSPEKIAAIVRNQPGVVMVDILDSLPEIVVVLSAPGRQQLADRIMQTIASVDGMVEETNLLPTKTGCSV